VSGNCITVNSAGGLSNEYKYAHCHKRTLIAWRWVYLKLSRLSTPAETETEMEKNMGSKYKKGWQRQSTISQ